MKKQCFLRDSLWCQDDCMARRIGQDDNGKYIPACAIIDSLETIAEKISDSD